MITKENTIILNQLSNGDNYITYEVDSNRFMLNKENGSLLYPETSSFNVIQLMNIGKHIHSLWKENSKEMPLFTIFTLD